MSIYLDNAATSWPKCPQVLAAMQQYLCECGGSPGRAGHGKSLTSSRMVYDTRDQLTALFNAASTDRVVFAKNATEALNMLLFGFLNPGDHIVTSAMEHNAVMRPLRQLEARGVKLSVAACDGYKDSESRAQSQNGFCGLPGRIPSNTGPKIVHIGGKNKLFFAYSEIPSYLCTPVCNAGKCGKI